DDFGDLHLSPPSPCINAGDPYGDYSGMTDIDSEPRVMWGWVDMGADEVPEPVPVDVAITPSTLNLSSGGNWITCSILLPGEYGPGIYCCILIDGVEIEAESVQAAQSGRHITAKFSRADIDYLLELGEIELRVFSQTSDGTWFTGSDTITISCQYMTASFQSLGGLAVGFGSIAADVTPDGSVVVGRSSRGSGKEAFRWTAEEGMVGLGDLPGSIFFSGATGVSSDGSIVVGYGHSASGQKGFRWTATERHGQFWR
ncbi:unnamed protein product, partial [marine sediment metagenome]